MNLALGESAISSKPVEKNQKHGTAVARLAVYIFVTILISSILLILNVGVVYALFTWVSRASLSEEYAQKIGQFVLFTGPFLLLFPEWLIYDSLVSPLRHKHK